MSQTTKPKLIIEWSPAHVVAFQPGHGRVQTGETVAAATVGTPTTDVLLAISRRTSFVRTTRVPNASYADVSLIVQNQLSGLFPISSNELAYDFHLTDDVNSEGRLALVAAIQADQLRQLQDECKAAGIKIACVLPAALGSVEVMRRHGIRDAAVVEVDDRGVAIDIVSHGVLRYSRWTAATRDVPAEVRRTFAAAGIEQLPILSAGGGTLESEYTASESTLLSLGQIDLASPPLNIELAETRAIRASRARAASLRLAATILVAGVAIASYAGYQRYQQIELVKTAVKKQDARVALLKKEDDKVKTESTSAGDRLDVVMRGFAPAQRFSEVLAALTNDAPTGVWLTGISMERGKPFSVRGTAMTADLAATYAQNLTHEGGRFRDVRLVNTSDTSIENRPVVQFSITGFPVGNLPLTAPPSTGSAAPSGSLQDTQNAVNASQGKS